MPIAASIGAIIAAVVLFFVWPQVSKGVLALGDFVAKNTNPLIVGLYGGLEKLLIPFGLHHIYNTPLLFTEIGGTYVTLDGARVVGTRTFTLHK